LFEVDPEIVVGKDRAGYARRLERKIAEASPPSNRFAVFCASSALASAVPSVEGVISNSRP
jgi:hypothetical protein